MGKPNVGPYMAGHEEEKEGKYVAFKTWFVTYNWLTNDIYGNGQ